MKGVNNFWTKFKTMFRLVVSSNGPDGVLEVALPVGDGEDLNTSTLGVSQVTTNRSCTDQVASKHTVLLLQNIQFESQLWIISFFQ